ncbi:MAG: NAD(P)H-hydrate dehydratase, partial [Chlamydiia bacterium]|nr:NAD(P)H-hydrate dehydratase [Chlamydiia bacterium]
NLVLPNDVRVMKPLIRRTRHKYEAGYVVGLAGSAGMAGAAILSATAAMRSGAGILRLLHPEGMEGELLNCPVEVIRAGYSPRDLDLLAQTMERASACYIGPGVARSPGIKAVLTHILPTLRMPCVIDADGINIMAEEGINPSQHTVLTPHLGEMRRLLGLASTPKLTSSFVSRCAEFATQHEVTLVLKGGPTLVMHPGEVPSVCPRGNPGMATAGSGDVLTGIIAGLLAQGLRQREAAIAGVYLHGVAGDYAAQKLTEYCMMASDICQSLPDAFRECFDLL